ncbi:N-acetyltransferase [uncultured Sphingomonas sp.]|uniref:GNAT family N-acetyltransferase n=1 Tax=uncultured Sphingomonas sp. TaxID=158754 RepID=UPI0030F55411
MIQMVPIAAVADAAVEQLLDRAFGHDRHARTAYRLRAGTQAIPALSFALIEGDVLLGSIQCWPVQLESDNGGVWPLVLVGPVAIIPERQQEGLGRRLMEAALAAAEGGPPLMLIGDPEYYGRFFGFDAAATAEWRLPGPVERHRLLARGTNVPASAGLLGPRRHALA